jgi:hypothetical protein
VSTIIMMSANIKKGDLKAECIIPSSPFSDQENDQMMIKPDYDLNYGEDYNEQITQGFMDEMEDNFESPFDNQLPYPENSGDDNDLIFIGSRSIEQVT